LKSKLLSFKTVVYERHDSNVKAWLVEVQDPVFEAVHAIDEFDTEVFKSNVEAELHITPMLRYITSLLFQLVYLIRKWKSKKETIGK